jgi:hypothetical protein
MKIITTSFFFISFCAAAAAQSGCTDPMANNYNAATTINDGSCTYNLTTVATNTIHSDTLALQVLETSGLLFFDGLLWTHNDSQDSSLYALDTANATITQSIPLQGLQNTDWEDIAQDSLYIYIGDFGNNARGNRQNLRIYKILKDSFYTPNRQIDTINFSYPEQTDFSNQAGNSSNFDCEAMIVGQDSIYLFKKQWTGGQTALYALPKIVGNHSAYLKTTYNIDGLVTGAAYLEQEKLVALCGYSSNFLQPFVFLLYDFAGNNFFSGHKRKLNLPLLAHQIEGIATINGLHFYLSNERVSSLNIPAKLHKIDLSAYTQNYLQPPPPVAITANTNSDKLKFELSPNPSNDYINISSDADFALQNSGYKIELFDALGQRILATTMQDINTRINWPTNTNNGLYFLKISENNQVLAVFKLIKQSN